MANSSKICQFFRFGLHSYKLAALRATIGRIITSCYHIKFMKIKGICYVTIAYGYITKNVCGP